MAGETPDEVLAQVLERLAKEAREGHFRAAAILVAGECIATFVAAGEVTQYEGKLRAVSRTVDQHNKLMQRAWTRVPQGPLT